MPLQHRFVSPNFCCDSASGKGAGSGLFRAQSWRLRPKGSNRVQLVTAARPLSRRMLAVGAEGAIPVLTPSHFDRYATKLVGGHLWGTMSVLSFELSVKCSAHCLSAPSLVGIGL